MVSEDKFNAIVCDAGSTGTRLYIYSIDSNGELTTITGKKAKPGLSSVQPDDAAEYLLPLIEDADRHIPPEVRSRVPIYVIATAGMRLLPQADQKTLYDRAVNDLKLLLKRRELPYHVDRNNFRTSSGLEEGFWGFLAANFLEHRLGSDLSESEGKELAGVLDLGGSSTQISFKCSAGGAEEDGEREIGRGDIVTEHGDEARQMFEKERHEDERSNATASDVNSTRKSEVRINDMFVHSFLGYGAVLARKRLEMFVASRQPQNPCDFEAYTRELAVSTSSADQEIISLKGTGSGVECREEIRESVIKAGSCDSPPCFFNNVSKPSSSVCGDFVAISLYFFAMDCLRSFAAGVRNFTSADVAPDEKEGRESAKYRPLNETETQVMDSFIHHWPRPSIREIAAVADVFCANNWENVATWYHDETPDMQSWSGRCFEVNYIATLLKDGYGLAEDSHSVTFVKDVKGSEIEWTLGAFLQERAKNPKAMFGTDDREISPTEIDLSDPITETDILAPVSFIVALLAIPGCLIALKMKNKTPYQIILESLNALNVDPTPSNNSQTTVTNSHGEEGQEMTQIAANGEQEGV